MLLGYQCVVDDWTLVIGCDYGLGDLLLRVLDGLHSDLHLHHHLDHLVVNLSVILSANTDGYNAGIGILIGNNENDRLHATTSLK